MSPDPTVRSWLAEQWHRIVPELGDLLGVIEAAGVGPSAVSAGDQLATAVTAYLRTVPESPDDSSGTVAAFLRGLLLYGQAGALLAAAQGREEGPLASAAVLAMAFAQADLAEAGAAIQG